MKTLKPIPVSKLLRHDKVINFSQDIIYSDVCCLGISFTCKDYIWKVQTNFLSFGQCQFPFRWIYNYASNKSIGKETGKTHFCALITKMALKIFWSFLVEVIRPAKLQNSDFQSHFSMSNIIWIFLKKNSLENINFGAQLL